MAVNYERYIRDPVHGYIGLTKGQTKVIDLPVFQRLRRVSQLSFADLVYPGGTHSRFSHSLGVMYLARRCIDVFKSLGLRVPALDLEAFELAALLHDIGHFPFSHVFQPVAALHLGNNKTDDTSFHEWWAQKILFDSRFGLIKLLGKDLAGRISKLIDHRDQTAPSLVREAMTGVFSIDRLDYLRRDALHAGVPEYAIVDWERILSTRLRYKPDPKGPVHHKKARYALEGALLSYFFMYSALYFHRTVRAACVLFQRALLDAFRPTGGILAKQDFTNPDFWIRFDDYTCLCLLADDRVAKTGIEALRSRKLPKMISQEEIGTGAAAVVTRLCQGGAFARRVEIEERLRKKLAKNWPKISLLAFDSPVILPYPTTPLAPGCAYLWDGNEESDLLPLEEAAQHLKLLTPAKEIRVYASQAWRTDKKKKQFINNLRDEISQVK